jgi:hypothetical protein
MKRTARTWSARELPGEALSWSASRSRAQK